MMSQTIVKKITPDLCALQLKQRVYVHAPIMAGLNISTVTSYIAQYRNFLVAAHDVFMQKIWFGFELFTVN